MKWSRRIFLKYLSLGSLGAISAVSGFRELTSLKNLKPPTLKKQSTIGMVSPGFVLSDGDNYSKIVDTIESLGFKVEVGKNAQNRFGYLAGTDTERAADLNTFFADPNIDAILPFRGGWGSNRILPLLDYDLIRENPKALIGFSDITSLLLSIYSKTGLITFHGPVGKSEWSDFTVSFFEDVLMSHKPVVFSNPPKTGTEDYVKLNTIYPGEATGPLLGGSLTVITSMLGSDYLPDWNGSILFVEDTGESIYRIDRMLTSLKLNGILDSINGFIFGRCTACPRNYEYGFSLEQILEKHIKRLKVPAFYGSMIGHLDHMFTLPIGISIKMDSTTGTIKMLEKATE